MIQLAHAAVQWTPDGCVTHFADGTSWGAQPHASPHYHVIAHRCGYGDDLLGYAREHDFCHSLIAEALRDRPSHVLWSLAHGLEQDPAENVMEEMAAQTLQRWLRANERPILGGVDWDALKARALRLLAQPYHSRPLGRPPTAPAVSAPAIARPAVLTLERTYPMKLASLIEAAAVGFAHQAVDAAKAEIKAEAKPAVDALKAKATDLFAELLGLAQTSFATTAATEVTDLATDNLDQAIASVQAGITAAVQHVAGSAAA